MSLDKRRRVFRRHGGDRTLAIEGVWVGGAGGRPSYVSGKWVADLNSVKRGGPGKGGGGVLLQAGEPGQPVAKFPACGKVCLMRKPPGRIRLAGKTRRWKGYWSR